MAKCKYALSVMVTALIGIAAAQKSQPLSSSSVKSGSDPLKVATKPLTPKSAMPAHRKTGAVTPKRATNNSKTTAELTHLERGQNGKAAGPKSSSVLPAKSASAKSAGTAAQNGSGIDFKYQKPVAQKPATTGAPSQGATPEVTKQN